MELARVRAEVEALRAEMEHQERLATLGTVAGLIAHEFNNILTPVLAYTQMSASEPGDEALARKAVERAGAGSERAAKIARAILGFVRKEGGGGGGGGVFHVEQGFGAGACDVRSVVEDTLLCVPRRGGAAVGVEIAPGLKAQIDGIALQQVLMNLVLNAHNAIGAGSGNIRIVGERVRGGGAAEEGEVVSGVAPTYSDMCTQISVIDSGPGMPPERAATVFAPFARGDGSRGTGLGMVVCKRLVEGCGGWMGVRSEVGVGTRVRVVVPGER